MGVALPGNARGRFVAEALGGSLRLYAEAWAWLLEDRQDTCMRMLKCSRLPGFPCVGGRRLMCVYLEAFLVLPAVAEEGACKCV